MQVWTPEPRTRDDGEFDVHLNPGADGRDPFAIIELSEDGNTALVMTTVSECDRLMVAAALAKSMLLGETSDPIDKHGHFDAPSAASVAEGLPVLDDDGDDRDDAEIAARDAAEAAEPGELYCTACGFPVDGRKYPLVHITADGSAMRHPVRLGTRPASSPLAPPRGYTTPAVEIPPREPDDHLPVHVGPSRECVTCHQETDENGRHVRQPGQPVTGKGVTR